MVHVYIYIFDFFVSQGIIFLGYVLYVVGDEENNRIKKLV